MNFSPEIFKELPIHPIKSLHGRKYDLRHYLFSFVLKDFLDGKKLI